jgi:hypothetical protein
MKRKQLLLVGALILATLLVSGIALAQDPGPAKPKETTGALTTAATATNLLLAPSTRFTYQGQLQKGGSPVSDTCAMQFSLYNAASGGVQVGSTINATVPITDGLFTVSLDFGSVFDSNLRWLEIQVQCPGDSVYIDLGRQELTAVPNALYAVSADSVPWSGLTGVPAGFADGVDDVGGGDGWSLTGNAGTTPGTNFLGTTDNQALELHVNGTRALRLEPDATSPNLVGGYSGNSVAAGVYGAVIGGGGDGTYPNHVTDHYGTVGGGQGNQAGSDNGDAFDAYYATVGGGSHNIASDMYATVGGGSINTADSNYAAIGGGYNNTVIGAYATVPGGQSNFAQGPYSLAAGRRARSTYIGSFVWADSTNADFASTANNQFAVRASGGVRLETGGAGATIDGSAVWHAGNDGADSDLDADLLDGQHGSYYQARVNYACAVGASIRAIHADGTVECQVDAPLHRPMLPAANTLRTLDSTGNVGLLSSATVVWTGLPLISYYDHTNFDLKVAYCEDVACTSTTITTLDSTGIVGEFPAVTMGADGLGLISYYDHTNGDLKVAHCNNVACTSATISTLDSTGDVGRYTSVTIVSDGRGLISYYDNTNDDLKVAHCNNVACTSATISTLASTGDAGKYTSIATQPNGWGVISYYDNGYLRLVHCQDVACSSALGLVLETVEGAGWYTSVAIGTDGLPLISYYDSTSGALKVAHCEPSLYCSDHTIATLDGIIDDVGHDTSVTIGVDGLPLVSYHDETSGDLKVAHCNDVACTHAAIRTLDSGGDVGEFTSVTIGADGLPLISYYDHTNYDLKVAHCTNAFCTPYFRRR